jgi:hypothetical protein
MNTTITNEPMVNKEKSIQYVEIEGTTYFKIENSERLRPFFMSVVSSGNHWMFIGSNGGLSAGRKDAENALFPYYTDDKIIESAEFTGSKSIFKVRKEETHVWEPFSFRYNKKFRISRNLYKSVYGNAVIFEEINHDLSLNFRYEWNSSAEYGFVKTSILENLSESPCELDFLDGLQNILPKDVGSELQNRSSNLVDAYKRTELHEASGLGIYALSAMIVDKAEPREALKANVVWSLGLENNEYLISSRQLNAFRNNKVLRKETDVKGEKGAYFVKNSLQLNGRETKTWNVIANVNQTNTDLIKLIESIENDNSLLDKVKQDIKSGTQKLVSLNASADGLQYTSDPLNDARHFSNVLFNIMRGGVFDFNYQIEREDFSFFVQTANKKVFNNHKEAIEALPEKFNLFELRTLSSKINDPNYKRIVTEYLPLKFSRRHGDPSRPWNKFSINTQRELDGTKVLDYQGNWRDIFQNWEALAHTFPEFIEGMIFKFLNATTFDGYNPYRVTKDGFDWETIEPDDPWSFIGYWGDHQIIYLLKFLEFIENRKPGKLDSFFDKDIFVYANVPYRIKSYSSIVKNPKDTIDFSSGADTQIREAKAKLGADGALLMNEKSQIYHVNFIEKILATVLAKLSNFIPEGGIWMNTQRPEWNDANNALVGNGVSVVTLCYLHRFLLFFQEQLENTSIESVKISNELMDFYKGVRKTFLDHEDLLSDKISDKQRKNILDNIGEIASDYRGHVYSSGFWGKKRSISIEGLKDFTRISLAFIEHSIEANRREDGMFHSYNLMTIDKNGVAVSNLSEMLEGQVAALSSKYLKPKEALSLLDGLKNSSLFRQDQYSYILYPNKNLPGFLEKNVIPIEAIFSSKLLQKLESLNDRQIIEKDVKGQYHFNGNFAYSVDLENALEGLKEPELQSLVSEEKDLVLQVFESVFNHKSFTGRSGTFFGYEGLGSIYWHMVSKLLLAVQECCIQAIEVNEDAKTIGRLMEHYYEIKAGIGVHKSPELFGAFPTDPYSHTPAGKGAQQPGMTGQVKEDILSQWGELGILVKQGEIHFYPRLLRREEFLDKEACFKYIDIEGKSQSLDLAKNTLAFTYCQIPIVYEIANENKISIHSKNKSVSFDTLYLDRETSEKVFRREGEILQITVMLKEDIIR